MSDGTKVKTEGGSGKQGGGHRNNFCNNNQPNNNTHSQTINIEELETTTYIVSHFYLANRCDKLTKEIIRYGIIKLPDRGTHCTWNARRQTTQHVNGYQAQTREESGWDISCEKLWVQAPGTGEETERKYLDVEEEEHVQGKPEDLWNPL